MKKFIFEAFFLLSICTTAYSQQSCANYPFNEGIEVQDVKGGTKILATAQVSVSMDDIDSIKDAREEATIEAKAMIAKFLTEDIKSESKIDKVVKESKQSDGQTVKVDRNELITRVKSLSNSAQALLRGVVPLGSCYTKAREFRVTVGLKPETIKSAENLAGSISNSVNNQPTQKNSSTNNKPNTSGTTNSTGGASQPLREMDGHSDTEKLNKF